MTTTQLPLGHWYPPYTIPRSMQELFVLVYKYSTIVFGTNLSVKIPLV